MSFQAKTIPKNQKITLDDKDRIVELYLSGMPAPKILLALDGKFKTTKTIYDVLQARGVARISKSSRIVACHDYFDRIDSDHKAYVLGLMIADGWNNEIKGEIGIQLQVRDEPTIRYIKEQWGTNRQIQNIKPKQIKNPRGAPYTSQSMRRIAVTSRQMSETLKNYGVVQGKSFTTILPLIEDAFMGCLLRGLLDGDGSIYLHSGTKTPCIRFLGSHYLAGQVSVYLRMKLGVTQAFPHPKGNISYVEWFNNKDVGQIARFIYQNHLIPKMERKYAHVASYLY